MAPLVLDQAEALVYPVGRLRLGAADLDQAQSIESAALMVRRLLEELCEEKGTKGANLQKGIAVLSEKAQEAGRHAISPSRVARRKI